MLRAIPLKGGIGKKNMAIGTAQLIADRQAMIADFPTEATLGAQVKNCFRSALLADDIAAAGGLLAGYKFSLHGVTSEWNPQAAVGDLLTIGGVEYRVLRRHDDVVGFRLDMGEKYAEG